MHGNQFRKRTDAEVSRPRIDLVADFELPHTRPDPGHDPGHVMTQHKRKAVGQDQLELAGFDFGVQQVQACGVDLDQNIVVPNFRVWHFAKPHRVFSCCTDQ